MKKKSLNYNWFITGYTFTHNVFGYEQFNFDIRSRNFDEGNIIKGLKRNSHN